MIGLPSVALGLPDFALTRPGCPSVALFTGISEIVFAFIVIVISQCYVCNFLKNFFIFNPAHLVFKGCPRVALFLKSCSLSLLMWKQKVILKFLQIIFEKPSGCPHSALTRPGCPSVALFTWIGNSCSLSLLLWFRNVDFGILEDMFIISISSTLVFNGCPRLPFS